MPINSYSYNLTTRRNGSVFGAVTYYYERSSIFMHESDGWKDEDVSYRDAKDMYEQLLNDRHKPDVTLDGVLVIAKGKRVEGNKA